MRTECKIRLGCWIGGVMIVFSTLAGVAGAEIASLGHIPDGSGRAAVTWTGATGVHPSIKGITGVVGRYRITATGKVPNYSQQQGLTSSPGGITLTLATMKGTLAGSPFTITITLTPGSGSQTSSGFARVTGTFHGLPVAATIYPPTTASGLQKDLGTFVGTIGSQHVQGTIAKPTGSHGRNTAHATFVVTG
jgi:hypothetical protein